MSKRISLNDREIKVMISLLKNAKEKGIDYENRWLGNQYINDLIEKLKPIEPTHQSKEV